MNDDGILTVNNENKRTACKCSSGKLLNTVFPWDKNKLSQTVCGKHRLKKGMIRESIKK